MKTLNRFFQLMLVVSGLFIAQNSFAVDPATVKADTTPFGTELATLVANRLDYGFDLYNNHRDYCGTGFMKSPNSSVYLFDFPRTTGYYVGTVYDGQSLSVSNYFATKQEFIKWLSEQSDASMSNCQNAFTCMNQTITRERLARYTGFPL